MSAEAQIADWMYLLGDLKGKKVERRVADAYAGILVAYPLELVRHAVMAAAADPDPFIPPVGGIIRLIALRLADLPGPHGRPAILLPGDAWAIARRTIASFHRETRPDPPSGDPAIDAALRRVGGFHACKWEDHIGEGIVRRAFLDAYQETATTPEHIAWALATGGRRVVVPGFVPVEGAPWTARAALPDGRARPDPLTLALPAPGSVVLSADARAAAWGDFKRQCAALVAAWRLDRADERQHGTPPPIINEDQADQLAGYPQLDITDAVRDALHRRDFKADQLAQRRQRYGT